MLSRPLPRANSLAIFFFVWTISALYLGLNLNRGWVPHDEGILSQSAERVLNRELPHRDFDEPYTGGLTYLNAAAFRVFGVDLMVLRWLLFAVFLVWVPIVFAIAREFCSSWPAAAVTLLAVVWSVPNYPAAMPSWYCLFLATFGIFALLRYISSPRAGWLVAAGICGGLSVLVKTPGLFYIAGVLLFLVFREQQTSKHSASTSDAVRSPVYGAFVVSSLALFMVVLAWVAMRPASASEFVHFVLPSLALSSLLVIREREESSATSWVRFKRFYSLSLPFLAGVAVPLSVFAALFWRSGALQPLLTNLFVNQLQRFTDARLAPPHWLFEFFAIPIAYFLFQNARSSRPSVLPVLSQVLLALALLMVCRRSVLAFLLVLDSVRATVPLLAAAVAILLYLRRKSREDGAQDQRIMLLVSVVSTLSLIQVPYAGPLYFCYFAALFFLALAAVFSLPPHRSTLNLAVAGAFLAVFAMFVFRPASIAAFEFERLPAFPNARLNLLRAGNLRVFDDQAATYQALIPSVIQHAAGKPILAGPDCPQIYFLSGLPNPTPFFFDFFEPPAKYKAHLREQLARPDFIKVVVVNDAPAFSRPYRDMILAALAEAHFSESRKFDKFEVFWRP